MDTVDEKRSEKSGNSWRWIDEGNGYQHCHAPSEDRKSFTERAEFLLFSSKDRVAVTIHLPRCRVRSRARTRKLAEELYATAIRALAARASEGGSK